MRSDADMKDGSFLNGYVVFQVWRSVPTLAVSLRPRSVNATGERTAEAARPTKKGRGWAPKVMGAQRQSERLTVTATGSPVEQVTVIVISLAVTGSLAASSAEEESEPESSTATQEARAKDSGMHDDNGSETGGSVTKDEAGKIATDKYGYEVKEAGSEDR